jgi:hypothetical protein
VIIFLGRRLAKEYDPCVGAGLAPAQGGVKRAEYVLDNRGPVAEYFIWNGQREEFDRGGVEAFSPTPMLLVMRHFRRGRRARLTGATGTGGGASRG